MRRGQAAPSSRRRLALAMGVATIAHSIFLSLLLRTSPTSPVASALNNQLVEFELYSEPILKPTVEAIAMESSAIAAEPDAAGPDSAEPESTAVANLNQDRMRAISPAARRLSIDGSEISVAGESIPAKALKDVSSKATTKKINLFLSGNQLSEILKSNPHNAPKSQKPDLWQGLHSADAERGLSPASPAITAGYRSAQLGPKNGTALLEVRVNAQGTVQSIRVIGGSGRAEWTAVSQDLLKRLKSKFLRVPSQARGMVFTLRIDRGDWATDRADQGRVKPIAAMGQEEPPRGVVRDNSARATFEESGRISPALKMFDSSWLSGSEKTRIRLESLNLL